MVGTKSTSFDLYPVESDIRDIAKPIKLGGRSITANNS